MLDRASEICDVTIIDRNQGYNEEFFVSHSLKRCDKSKIAWRIYKPNNMHHEKDWMIKESELDDDQIKVLMGTLDKSCIVSGCAGSGKSVLALIKAQRIQKEFGNNYKIIVFTKALCNYMNSGKQELGLTNDFYYHKEWKYQRERRGRFWYIVGMKWEYDSIYAIS